jgi:hypothetical protein
VRRGGGKAKGASFERDVCKALSLWVSNGTQEDVYWRSAMSGGRSTVARAKGKRLAEQAGDITCIHRSGQSFADKFFMECKFYKDLQYTGLLTGKGNLVKFWSEASKQAKHYGKLPFMIAKQNQQPATVCLSREGMRLLDLDPLISVPTLNLRIVLFDTFLQKAVRLPHEPTYNRSRRIQRLAS